MKPSPWERDEKEVARAAAEKKRRIEAMLRRMRERASTKIDSINGSPSDQKPTPALALPPNDCDFGTLNIRPNEDFCRFVQLFDEVASSNEPLHLALLWPHTPPRAILPWIIREVARGKQPGPMRTLFVNIGRPAMQMLSGLAAGTAQLHARGLIRANVDDSTNSNRPITPDAHFYLFLGDRTNSIDSVPIVSIVPHAIAIDDGIYWRDFDEKTLKGFKRHFSTERLRAIQKHLDILTSAERGPGFAFLLPAYFDPTARRRAVARIPGSIDLIVIDMTLQTVAGRDASALLCDILSDLEQSSARIATRVLVITDCPLRFSFLRRSARRRRDSGVLGNKLESHRLLWRTRGRGFQPIPTLTAPAVPIVETVASEESIIAGRLWLCARELDESNPLASVLRDAAATLKGIALTASSAPAILAPYQDVHDVYHRMKRERHSFDPHYNKALALLAEGAGGPLKEKIANALATGLDLANAMLSDTPLLRYLKRLLDTGASNEDILVVLRHPEDAQQTGERLLDYLTEPGRFVGAVPSVRPPTPYRYEGSLETQRPTIVV